MASINDLDDLALTRILRPHSAKDEDVANFSQVNRAFREILSEESERRRLRFRCKEHGQYVAADESLAVLRQLCEDLQIDRIVPECRDVSLPISDGFFWADGEQVWVKSKNVSPSVGASDRGNVYATHPEGALRPPVKLHIPADESEGPIRLGEMNCCSKWICVVAGGCKLPRLNIYDAVTGQAKGRSSRQVYLFTPGPKWALDDGGVTALVTCMTSIILSTWSCEQGWQDHGVLQIPELIGGVFRLRTSSIAQSRTKVIVGKHNQADFYSMTHNIYCMDRTASPANVWTKIDIDMTMHASSGLSLGLWELALNERFIVATFGDVFVIPPQQSHRNPQYVVQDLSGALQPRWSEPLDRRVAEPGTFCVYLSGGILAFCNEQNATLCRVLDGAKLSIVSSVEGDS